MQALELDRERSSEVLDEIVADITLAVERAPGLAAWVLALRIHAVGRAHACPRLQVALPLLDEDLGADRRVPSVGLVLALDGARLGVEIRPARVAAEPSEHLGVR